MQIKYQATRYQPEDVVTGIVHLGLGAFMRSHLAVYTEAVLNLTPAQPPAWGICAVNIRSNAVIVDTLQQQQCCYHVAEYQNSEEVCLRQISSLREVMFAGDAQHSHQLLTRLQDPLIKIVSLTITEKGYYLNPADGRLRADHELIQRDLATPEAPCTAIGILTAALAHRFKHQQLPFTLLSCDNMPSNGKALKSALVQFAALQQPELSRWIASEVLCPSTMVDRIVPAVTDEKLQEINALLAAANTTHVADNAAVAAENFSQWVIEDSFTQGRPDWNLVGAEFVQNVEPYETMKLRLLNGAHSLLAYLGSLGQLAYVADCMNTPDYVALIRYYMWHEAMPTLEMPEGVDLGAYAESLLARFRNDSLKHKTMQIAMDGSQKIPQRWLAGVQHQLDHGTLPIVGALGLAAWMRYLTGINELGQHYKVDDPMAETLQKISANYADIGERVAALLQTSVFAGTTLRNNQQFVALIVGFYQQLLEQGARDTVQQLVSELGQ